MGIGGHFWDLLKPYAQFEGFDFLRDKKVAVDLSYWVVQHETAIRSQNARNPHIRITFFRTINLFSKLGAFPVFVLDGVPSRLKSRARIERFLRATSVDLSDLLPPLGAGVSPERNRYFKKCVSECVELLELLGMPILQASHEAEALCAELNREGQVDACITADSDAFLYGAKCVIKCLRLNSKEPIEYYLMSDIEVGLGLTRNHLVAISLLAGNDHDLGGVPGIGVETAVRFVKMFSEQEILERLHEIGKGETFLLQGALDVAIVCNTGNSDQSSPKMKTPHCSNCGHPGTKRAHHNVSCEYCNIHGHEKCTQKPAGFKCECFNCIKDRRSKDQIKHHNWQVKICNKIAGVKNFPNEEIIQMYLRQKHEGFNDKIAPSILWNSPKIESLVDFLGHHQKWEPCFVRQRMLPMLSTILLREMASDPNRELLLCDQYKFHSICRLKVRYGHQFYVVKWARYAPSVGDSLCKLVCVHADPPRNEPDRMVMSPDSITVPEASKSDRLDKSIDIITILEDDRKQGESDRVDEFIDGMKTAQPDPLHSQSARLEESFEAIAISHADTHLSESNRPEGPIIAIIPQADLERSESPRVFDSIDAFDNQLDEADLPEILVDGGSYFLLTDEHKELVLAAFPEKAKQFLLETESKKRTKHKSKSESPKSGGVQLTITEFYRSSKLRVRPQHGDELLEVSDGGVESQKDSRKVRRRLFH